MSTGKILVSRHAMKRMAQRNLKPRDIAIVIRFGRKLYRTGVQFFFLGKRDLPRGSERELEKLVGATVVASGDHILTAYRNKKAVGRIKRKLKWELAGLEPA